jgi:hypothetical protein
LQSDIATAVAVGMKKFQKYCTFMDATDSYYAAIILDPRIKGALLEEQVAEDVPLIMNAKKRIYMICILLNLCWNRIPSSCRNHLI